MHAKSSARSNVTRELAAFAVNSRFETLPENVQREAARAFLNHTGCVFGGCREPAVQAAIAVAQETGGQPQATLIGQGIKTDIVNAAFVNCLASAAMAYDDTHLATVTHPTGPVASALFAYAEREKVSGEDFLCALAIGIEIECRLSTVLLLPPAKANLALYITGITGPVGAAAALARLMRLNEEKTAWAMGLAAAQAAGFRATHASMAGAFPPAHAARAGLLGALLAANGHSCSDHMIEGDRGLIDIFSTDADPALAVAELGERFEMLSNAYKPYPAGIVVQPVIDACLDLVGNLPENAEIAAIELTVHPLTVTLADRTQPATFWQAQISVQHWAAAALLRRQAGIAEMRDACIHDPAIAVMRARVTVSVEAEYGRDEAHAIVHLADGTSHAAHVTNARGSAARPMTDEELDAKFRGQVSTVLTETQTTALLLACRQVHLARDVGRALSWIWDS